MYPFIHIAQFSVGTSGFACGWRPCAPAGRCIANFRRYGVDADAIGVAAYTTVGGVDGAGGVARAGRARACCFISRRWCYLIRAGFAWFGGLLAGIAVLLWSGRQAKTGGLAMLDLAAPAVAVGYGVGRLGCLISGDGDYGNPTNLPWGMSFPHGLVPPIQRVHPTPIYEFLVALVIARYLWWRGTRTAGPLPLGQDHGRIPPARVA